jgi:hypothetical protein
VLTPSGLVKPRPVWPVGRWKACLLGRGLKEERWYCTVGLLPPTARAESAKVLAKLTVELRRGMLAPGSRAHPGWPRRLRSATRLSRHLPITVPGSRSVLEFLHRVIAGLVEARLFDSVLPSGSTGRPDRTIAGAGLAPQHHLAPTPVDVASLGAIHLVPLSCRSSRRRLRVREGRARHF